MLKHIHSVGLPPGLLRMMDNENPLGPSPHALEAIANYMRSLNRYEWFEREENGDLTHLKPAEMVIRALAQENRIPLPQPFDLNAPHPIFLAPGVDQILKLLAVAYLTPGNRELVEAEVTYGEISEKAQDINNAGIPTRVIRVPMTTDHKHDLDAMLNAITPRTYLAVITNPNNPTGTLLSYEAIERFVDAVPDHVIVVVDEAYYHFIKEPNYQSAIALATTRDNVIVVRTFAKVYGIRGVMVGYAVTSQAIKQNLMLYNSGRISPLALMAALAAFGDHEHVRRSRETVIASREYLFQTFEEMGLEYTPSETNFVQFNVKRDTEAVREALLNCCIAISPRGSHVMKGWLRVSVGTMEETETFIRTLREVLKTVPEH